MFKDKPQVIGQCDFDQTKFGPWFNAGLAMGFVWVEAIPVSDGQVIIVGHTSSRGRDRSKNWQLGRA